MSRSAQQYRGCGREADRSGAPLAWIAVLCIGFAGTVAGQELVWEPTAGPYGGVIHSLWEADDGRIYAGTDSGEVYRTSDRARSWSLFTSDISDRPILSFLDRGGELYVGTDGRGVRFLTRIDTRRDHHQIGIDERPAGTILVDEKRRSR